MLFMCQGKTSPGCPDERQRVLQLFASWRRPPGWRSRRTTLRTGGDYVVVETSSVEALIEATAVWAPFVDYEVTPIVTSGRRRRHPARRGDPADSDLNPSRPTPRLTLPAKYA